MFKLYDGDIRAQVKRDLDRRLGFLNIAAVVAETLERATAEGVMSGSDDACEAALAVDARARRIAETIVGGLADAA